MKKIAAAVAALAALVMLTGAASIRSNTATGSRERTDAFFGRPTVPGRSLQGAMEKTGYQPIGTVVLCFDDGDSSFLLFKDLADAILNGTTFKPTGWFTGDGVYGASTYVKGETLRATNFIMPTVIGAAGAMTVSDLQGMDQSRFEMGSHGPDTQRLGAVGMAIGGARVSGFGETGMSRTFFRAALGAYQDSADAWGIPRFVSHGAANWRYAPGADYYWREAGYLQQKTLCVRVTSSQTDVNGNELTVGQVNNDIWPPSLFGRQGSFNPSFDGYHRIGEPISPFDVGSRGSYTYAEGTAGVDSIKTAIDIAIMTKSILILTLHDIVREGGAGAGPNSIQYPWLEDLCRYIAHRCKEGVLESRTFAQAADRIRGYPVGEQTYTNNFWIFRNSTYRSPNTQMDTLHVPLGLLPANGATALFGAANDTIFKPAGLGGGNNFWKLSGNDLTYTGVGDTIYDAYSAGGVLDSLTYGLSEKPPYSRVLVTRTTTTQTNVLTNVIRVTGHRSRYLVLAVEWMAIDNGAANWDTQGPFHAQLMAGGFSENWEDNVNAGVAAYANMADIMAGSPNFATFNWDRMRVRPNFAMWPGDTTQSILWIDDEPTSLVWETTRGKSRWMSPWGGRPYIRGLTGNTGWDFVSEFGNATDFLNVGSAGDDHDDNEILIKRWHYPYTTVWYIPLHPLDDMVWVGMSIRSLDTALSTNGHVAVLNYSATLN